MKFYSRVVNKPNAIIEEVKHGTQTVKQVKLCTFINGVFETEDPEIIIKLKKRPDLFRTDRPWIGKPDWRTEEGGAELLKEGERLGIDCKHLRKHYLQQLIAEKTGEKLTKKEAIVEKKEEPKKIDYKEMIKLAKEKGIKGIGVKKEILKKKLKESGVNV